MAIGYKVFTQIQYRLFSVLNYRSFSFQYNIKKPNYPKKGNGPFAVFKTKKEAEKFANDLNQYRDYDEFHVVKKVRYVKSKAKTLYYCSYSNGKVVKEVYKQLCETNCINPKNADLASKVTILE